MDINLAKQLAYQYDRKEHTCKLLRETNPAVAPIVEPIEVMPRLEREDVVLFNGS